MTKTTLETPIGPIVLLAEGGALAGAWLPDAPPPDGDERPDDPVLSAAAGQLAEYFAGRRREFDLPLAGRGTPFQRRVWQALRDIPFGETASYADVARAIGRPTATRAVGAANGANPLPIFVPCHRVIGKSGRLTGYGGGLDAKRWLLDHEANVRG